MFDPVNGTMKTTVISEAVVMERSGRHKTKMSLQYDTSAAGKKTAEVGIIHRQGCRLLCDKKMYTALVTVTVYEGGSNDNTIYAEISATVKLPKAAKENSLGGFDRTTSSKPGVVTLKKKVTTYEARERLGLGAFAPALDLAWWQDNRREEMWRELIGQLGEPPPRNEAMT